ncbi:hypothetical protein RIF29_19531 [Crotalaria pallida]|uniref:Uncharacterized protein n=1 Tax=Crotalaria pallida TaxID=3830 RepID=A0AAN9I483_CROPI
MNATSTVSIVWAMRFAITASQLATRTIILFRVVDINKDLDLNGVQEFVINGAKVIFLNKRGRCVSQTKPNGGCTIRNNVCKNTMTECMTCQRSLVEPSCFCSIECKLECIRKDESGSFVLSVKKDEEMKELPEEMKGVVHEELPTLPSEEKEKKVEEGTSKEVSKTVISPDPDKPTPRPVNYNSRKRKGIPRRAPFF